MSKQLRLPTGWLSPEGKMYECEYYEHLPLAGDIAKKLGASANEMWTPDEYLFNHGWVCIGRVMFISHGYVVNFPNSRTISQEQRRYLKPFVEDDINIFAKVGNLDLMLEFEEFFYKESE